MGTSVAIKSPSSCALQTGSAVVLVLSSVLCSFPLISRGAEYVEIRAELTSTFESSARTNLDSFSATCIVGTNDWFLSGDFAFNSHSEYWLVSSNIVERRVFTTSMYEQRAKDFVSEKILKQGPSKPIPGSYPWAGETHTTVRSWEQPFGIGVERVFWLAFCSGSYLQKGARQIPLPIGPVSRASGFSDKTVLLEGGQGLPQETKLYMTGGQLVCAYEVLGTTNFFGRRFPLAFRLIQYGNPPRELTASGGPKYTVMGRVSSIRIGKKPEVPKGIPN